MVAFTLFEYNSLIITFWRPHWSLSEGCCSLPVGTLGSADLGRSDVDGAGGLAGAASNSTD